MIAALPACAGPLLQAPFDGYVCENASFNKCLSDTSAVAVSSLRAHLYGQFFASDSFPKVKDDKAGKENQTTASQTLGTFTCRYGQIPYQTTIQPDAEQRIVLVPAALFLAIGEAMVELDRLRNACDQLVADFNLSAQVIDEQDNEATAQTDAQKISADVETLSLNNIKFQNAPQMHDARTRATSSAQALRTFAKKGVAATYSRQFSAAQAAIDAQTRLVARYLQQLDISAVPPLRSAKLRLLVATGSWVQQGRPIAQLSRE